MRTAILGEGKEDADLIISSFPLPVEGDRPGDRGRAGSSHAEPVAGDKRQEKLPKSWHSNTGS